MNIHVCKQCGARFVYCRACVFRPIRYKENGFCSKECYEASKIKVVPEIEIEPIKEEIKPIEEVETGAIATEEASIETTAMVEPIIKNETNTYKKKKNKYKVHE